MNLPVMNIYAKKMLPQEPIPCLRTLVSYFRVGESKLIFV